MKKLCCCFVYCLVSKNLFSQPSRPLVYPEVGKAMPAFVLNDVQNYSTNKAKIGDFKGKWLILDWWTKYCASCVESFPKVDTLQRQFGDRVQFIMIGFTGSWKINGVNDPGEKQVKAIYAASKKAFDLRIPFAFDSTLYQKFHLGTTPYVVVVDPDGIVQNIGDGINAADMRNLLAGRKIHIAPAYRLDQEKPKYDHTIPLLTFGNGGIDTSFLFRSLLTKWEPGTAVAGSYIVRNSESRTFEEIGIDLERLYQLAYFGQYSWGYGDSAYGKLFPHIVVETKDAAKFKSDWATGIGAFNYSLSFPNRNITRNQIMDAMKRDLKTYFGFDVSIEERIMPYWKLTVLPERIDKLKARGDTTFAKSIGNSRAGFIWKNKPLWILINNLSVNFQNFPPFIDETGIEGNIDLSIEAALTSFTDFKNALAEKGLVLVPGEKKMKVIVIKDRRDLVY